MESRPLVEEPMWDQLAGAWDARGDWHADTTRPVTEAMVRLAAPADDDVVVELAGGPTADCALAVAALPRPPRRIIASDASQAMVQAAARRVAAHGAAVECQVLDATALALDNGGVGVLFARWLYMLLPEPATGLNEAARVLAPGGRLVFSAFAEPSSNPFFMVPAGVLIERGLLRPPTSGQPSMFALADPDRLRLLVAQAGLQDVHIEKVPVTYRLADRADLRSYLTQFTGPIALALSALGASDADALLGEIEHRLTAFTDGTGYALPATALVIAATASRS